eukprot:gene8013-8873_t
MKSNFNGKRSNANISIAGSQQSSYASHRGPGVRGSKNTLYTSNSRKNVAIDERSQKAPTNKSVVQVVDEQGHDVTPKSLLPGDFNAQKKSGTFIGGETSSIGTPSELAMSQSIYGASMHTSYAQGFTRSMMGSVMGASSRVSLDSINDEITEPSHTQDFSAGLADIQTRRAYVKEELTEEDLNKMISVNLTETDTIWLLDLPGTSIAKDSEDAQKVINQNERYEELMKNRAGNDMYIERGMQTYNNAPKHKELQTIPVGKQEIGCMATTWDVYDTYAKIETKVEGKSTGDVVESLSRPSSPTAATGDATEALPTVVETSDLSLMSLRKSSSIQSLMTESKASFATTSSPSEYGDATERESTGQINVDLQADKILKLDSFKKNLFTIERAVVQNIFHSKQATYRGLSPASDLHKEGSDTDKEELGKKLGSNLARLWSYSCLLTKGKKVNCMAWNKVNNDLLAVGYGNFGSANQGLVCCWSLKNPEYPERCYHLHAAVTSIDFSSSFPNLLAVGLYDGTIAIINVRHSAESPVLDSSDSQGKQSGPIWQLRWVDRNRGTGEDKGGEILVSSSADGRITQWSIRKGFEYQDLMKLKKMNTWKQFGKSPTKADKKGDALISRYVSAMCFDFYPNDGNIYLAGTEEGNIHKCSCSYNEQFLETYVGHTGAVYKVIWCPLLPDAFISCSADWSIRLWHQDKQVPVLTLSSAQEALNDIDWSPHSPTVIGAVNDKQIEIWDLSHSTLDPLIVNVSVDPNVQLTSIIFSLDSEIIMIGDSEGHLTVYQLRAMPHASQNQVDVLSKIIHSLEDGKSDVTSTTDEVNKADAIDR